MKRSDFRPHGADARPRKAAREGIGRPPSSSVQKRCHIIRRAVQYPPISEIFTGEIRCNIGKIGISIILGIALNAAISCALLDGEQTPTPAPTPTPTPEPVQDLYDRFRRVQEENPTRAEWLEDQPWVYRVRGEITTIEGSDLQFHIQKRQFAKDDYLECKFPRDDDVIFFKVGEIVDVEGRLESGAGQVIVLKECRRMR